MAEPVVATYSIAACDLDAGQWGVATQSKFLAVGSVVPWAEPGVGAIATQAYANPRYGPDGLALLREGARAAEDGRAADRRGRRPRDRQLGVVDANGGSATYTGAACMDWAGGLAGPGFAAQGNILVGEETVAALATTFEATDGTAARRAAARMPRRRAGGGRRPARAAVGGAARRRARRRLRGLSDVLVDLRVDDQPQPVAELARMYDVARAAVRQDAARALARRRRRAARRAARPARDARLRRRPRRGARRLVGHGEPRGARRRRRADRPGRARGAARAMTDAGYEILSIDDLDRLRDRPTGR